MNALTQQYKNSFRQEREHLFAKQAALEEIGVEEYMKKNPGTSRERALKALQEKRNKPMYGPGSDEHNRQTAIGMNKYLAGKAPGAN